MGNNRTGPDFNKDWDWEDFLKWKATLDALNPDKKGPDSKKSPIHNLKRRR